MNREEELKARLTPEFLATLMEAARVYGWQGDYHEVAEFVKWCNEQVGITVPQVLLEPYGEEDDQ